MTYNKKKLSLALTVLLILFGGLSFAYDDSDIYYHYDLSLDEYEALPIAFENRKGQIPSSFIDINDQIVFNNILDTRYFDEDYPAVQIESSYKVIDILELSSNNIYVVAEKKDKIVRVFSKEEFNKFYADFSKLGIFISYLNGGYNTFDQVFEDIGVKDSVNKESSSSIRFFEEDMERFKLDIYDLDGSKKTLSYNGYYTPIGNVISGKYLIDLADIKTKHEGFCQLVYINKTASNGLDENKITNAAYYSNFYGEKFMPYNNFLKLDNTLEYVSRKSYNFKKESEFSNFINSEDLSNNEKVMYSPNEMYKIHKTLILDGEISIESETSELLTMNSDTSNNRDRISLIENSVASYGVRTVISNDGIQIIAVPFYDSNLFASEESNSTKIFKLSNSLFYCTSDYMTDESPFSKSIIRSMADYQLQLLGIEKDIRE